MENEHQKVWGTPDKQKKVKPNPDLIEAAQIWQYPIGILIVIIFEKLIGFLIGYYFLQGISAQTLLITILSIGVLLRLFIGYLTFVKIFNKTNTKTAFKWLCGLCILGWGTGGQSLRQEFVPLGVEPNFITGINAAALLVTLIAFYVILSKKNKDRWQ